MVHEALPGGLEAGLGGPAVPERLRCLAQDAAEGGGRAALVVFAVSFDGMPDFKGSLLALLDPENLGFIVAYCTVGGLFAGLIFAVSVVSIPMILDRRTDAITAGLASLKLVLDQPLVMLLWGATITLLVAVALLPWYLGLLVVAPVVGHASWHAYRDAVPG